MYPGIPVNQNEYLMRVYGTDQLIHCKKNSLPKENRGSADGDDPVGQLHPRVV
jgi:hypothetical protein